MNNDFIEIVKAAQSGDNNAFEALYNMTKDSAYFIALSITKNEQDALDIMQDSYIKAFESISTLNTPKLFDNWMGRIVANTSKNYIKKKKPMLFADMGNAALGEWNDEEFNKDYLPHESIDTKETSRLLMEIINELSEDKRLCILMYYYQDMSVKEISEVLELPVSTIKYKLLSARAEIKKGVEALEKKDTKLYGIFPFMLFPALFKSMETEFCKLHLSPQYSSLNLSANVVQIQEVASQAVKAAAKKGLFSTFTGKAAVIAATAIIMGGIITAVMITLNSSGTSDSQSDSHTVTSSKTDIPISDSSSENISVYEQELSALSFNLDGVTYSLPCDYSTFTKNGWKIVNDSDVNENEILKSYESSDMLEIQKTDSNFEYVKIKIGFTNLTETDSKIKDSKVCSIVFVTDHSAVKQNQPEINIAGGLTINQALTVEDILDKYGDTYLSEDDSWYEDSKGNRLKYHELNYQESDGDYIKETKFLILNDEYVLDDRTNEIYLGYEFKKGKE